MMMNRRRFITIAATAAAGAALYHREPPMRWQGVAMGADVSIDLGAAAGTGAQAAMSAAIDTIRRMESLFSIYDPESALSRLNRFGRISAEPEFAQLIRLAGHAHALTGGLFDPTVQPLVKARMHGRTPLTAEWSQVGWEHVGINEAEIFFHKPGMAMTLNGIAQGFATDRVSEVLASHGYSQTVVNIGEYKVGERLAAIGVGGAENKLLLIEEVSHAAIATSVPGAYRFADMSPHILNPREFGATPAWASASVIADTATMADALSTALVLANGTELGERLAKGPAKKIILENLAGKIIRI